MKILDLMIKLTELYKEHGNLEVKFENFDVDRDEKRCWDIDKVTLVKNHPYHVEKELPFILLS